VNSFGFTALLARAAVAMHPSRIDHSLASQKVTTTTEAAITITTFQNDVNAKQTPSTRALSGGAEGAQACDIPRGSNPGATGLENTKDIVVVVWVVAASRFAVRLMLTSMEPASLGAQRLR
jgi:hypothetical protein